MALMFGILLLSNVRALRVCSQGLQQRSQAPTQSGAQVVGTVKLKDGLILTNAHSPWGQVC